MGGRIAAPTIMRRSFQVGRRFSTPMAAQTWYEIAHAGFFFPATLLLFALLSKALCAYISLEFFPIERNHYASLFSAFFGQPWSYEIVPLIALFLAACAWAMRSGWAAKGREQGCTSFGTRLPISTLEMTQARLLAVAINLGCNFHITALKRRFAAL